MILGMAQTAISLKILCAVTAPVAKGRESISYSDSREMRSRNDERGAPGLSRCPAGTASGTRGFLHGVPVPIPPARPCRGWGNWATKRLRRLCSPAAASSCPQTGTSPTGWPDVPRCQVLRGWRSPRGFPSRTDESPLFYSINSGG